MSGYYTDEDPYFAEHCNNGHYHCPPCPIDQGTDRQHAGCECDHGSEDEPNETTDPYNTPRLTP